MMNKKMLAWLLAAVMLLSMAACKKPVEPVETTPAATDPATDETEHFDLSEIDLEGIGELLAQRDETAVSHIRLDGLCTPVELELQGTELISITAYDSTVTVDPAAEEYSSIYGNLWPVIYDYGELIVLNIWHDEIGYTCVIFPDNSYLETFPGEEFSVMVYEEEGGKLVQYQFAMKFLGIDQWDTGPIDQATKRDDFYYSIDDAQWDGEAFHVISRDSYTISDCYELDEIFDAAKESGLYPGFETLEELFAYNEQRFNEAEDVTNESSAVREETGYFDQIFLAEDYDGWGNLLTQTYYDSFGNEYFTKSYTYNGSNREIGGSWCFRGEEIYRYTNTYTEDGKLSETVWYQDDQEVERFAYDYHGDGYTQTFSRNGEKQYAYTFDNAGELTAHSVYKNGEVIKTQDISSLVKTELLTDIWFPVIDSEALHTHYDYDGTVPAPVLMPNAQISRAADGSYTVLSNDIDEEDGTTYEHEYHYDAQHQLIKSVHRADGVEFNRDEYKYDSSGRRIEQIFYVDGTLQLTRKFSYNEKGQMVREDRTSTEPEIQYIYEVDENGMEVTREITYTDKTELHRYNDQGLLVETVSYADGEEFLTETYAYDVNGYILPSMDTYEYVYDPEGVLEGIWLLYEDHAAGMALLRSHTVYVTPENARQLQEIMRNELSWF